MSVTTNKPVFIGAGNFLTFPFYQLAKICREKKYSLLGVTQIRPPKVGCHPKIRMFTKKTLNIFKIDRPMPILNQKFHFEILAAMSSSRSDIVTQAVCTSVHLPAYPSVRPFFLFCQNPNLTSTSTQRLGLT